MVSVQDTRVCDSCGEEYLYDCDCRTGEVSKLSMCKCDREYRDTQDFLKNRKLLTEFRKFHIERERERKRGRFDEKFEGV